MISGIIEQVWEFRYLGRVLLKDDKDTVCIRGQLKRAWQQWQSVVHVLKQDGASAHTMTKFYIAIVQAVLLYGADLWTIARQDYAALERFHKRAAQHITRRHICKSAEGIWSYPDHAGILQSCRLHPINVYVERCRGTLHTYLDACKPEFINKVQALSRPARDPHRVLWCCQLLRERDADEATGI